jgi:aspartate kinase
MLVVQKYGGTSVATIERIANVARRVIEYKKRGDGLVIVVSAMSGETDRLLGLAHGIGKFPDEREVDVLISTGEQVTSALLAITLKEMGQNAVSVLGHQVPIVTDSAFGKARISDIDETKIRTEIENGKIVVVPGFQGVDEAGNITTLGRGGSDTTAVAVAAALKADVCEIYTDVDGVFSADPRIVPSARRLPRITYEEMLEMAAAGAKVLHLRCVEYARRYDIPIHVRSSFSTREGTYVVAAGGQQGPGAPEGDVMEQAIIAGVAHDRSEGKVTVVGVPDKPGEAAAIFRAVADAEINIDMIVQNVSAATTGRTDISFTLPKTDGAKALSTLEKARDAIGFEALQWDDQIGKVSLVGAAMRSHPGVSATFFEALADAGVNVELISTSEIRISVVCRADAVDDAVRAVHSAFGLDSDGTEAVVYGGSGR